MRQKSFYVLALLVVTMCYAVAQSVPTVDADIPFSFSVEAKTLPAGSYQFREGENPDVIVVSNTKTRESVMARVITRIGSQADRESDIVFDLTGNDHSLSEVHIAGMDGYLLKATSGKHTHVHIKARK